MAGDESRLLNLEQQRPQRNSKAGRVGKLDTAGTAVDKADSAPRGVGRKGHFVAHTADSEFHPKMHRRGHTLAPVPYKCLRRVNPEV